MSKRAVAMIIVGVRKKKLGNINLTDFENCLEHFDHKNSKRFSSTWQSMSLGDVDSEIDDKNLF